MLGWTHNTCLKACIKTFLYKLYVVMLHIIEKGGSWKNYDYPIWRNQGNFKFLYISYIGIHRITKKSQLLRFCYAKLAVILTTILYILHKVRDHVAFQTCSHIRACPNTIPWNSTLKCIRTQKVTNLSLMHGWGGQTFYHYDNNSFFAKNGDVIPQVLLRY